MKVWTLHTQGYVQLIMQDMLKTLVNPTISP